MSRIFATANRRFFATHIVVSLGGKFAASLPCGKDRRQHRPPERPHLERRDPRGRRPAGRSDHVLELPGVLPRRPHHPGRPLHGRRGEADRLLAPHAGADRTVGQRLDEEEGVGGTGTGERRDDVEQFLAGELGHLREGGEDLPGPLLLFPRNPPGEEEAGAPHPHLSRSVRHRADDAGALPQGGQESPGRNPRGDRDEELALRFARTDQAERLSHALRLHREDDRVALPQQVRHPRPGPAPRNAFRQPFPEPDEIRPALLGILRPRGDGHQPPQADAGKSRGGLDQRGQLLRDQPRLGFLPSEVHLQEDGDDLPGLGRPTGYFPEEREGVDRLDPREERDGLFHLVPLELPDQVPLGAREGADLSFRLLDVIFPEDGEPGLEGLSDALRRLGLSDRHQTDLLPFSPGSPRGLRDPVPDPRRALPDRFPGGHPLSAYRYQPGPSRETAMRSARRSIPTTRVMGSPTTLVYDPTIRSISRLPVPCAAYAPALSAASPVRR